MFIRVVNEATAFQRPASLPCAPGALGGVTETIWTALSEVLSRGLRDPKPGRHVAHIVQGPAHLHLPPLSWLIIHPPVEVCVFGCGNRGSVGT